MNYKIILHTLGWVLNIEAGCMILPLICSLIYSDGCVLNFISCILICLITGLLLTLRSPKNKTMYAKEGFIIVSLSWVLISIFGALPFIFSGNYPKSYEYYTKNLESFQVLSITKSSTIVEFL